MQGKSQKIALAGMLIAMSVVLTRFASIRLTVGSVEGVRIGFGTFPIILGGLIFGPLWGGIVGALADVIGFSLSPVGPYFPHFTLTSALYGVIPGILALLPFQKRTAQLLWSVLLPQVGIGCLLTPYFLHTLFDMPWKILLIPRLVSTPLNIVFYAFLLFGLSRTPVLAPSAHR
ncbi:MAG: folate family ECF transporter S component [Candidatus Caldatribacteriaceae bacterium]